MLRFCESFDHHTDVSSKWDGTKNGFWGVSQSIPAGRFGTVGGQAVNLGLGTLDSRRGAYKNFVGSTETTWTVGFAARIYGYSNGQPVLLLGFYEIASGVHVGVWVDSNGHLLVRRGTTTLATTSYIAPTTAFVFFEFKATVHDTAGAYELRADGVTLLSGSSVDTRNGGSGVVDQINFSGGVDSGDGAVIAYAIDDIYMLDSVDSGVSLHPNNSFLGDVRVQALLPSGNGATSNLVGSDGNSVNNYPLVDEVPPNDDTDYVESANVGDKDTYAYGDLAASSGTVFGVQILPYAKRTDAGARSIASVARLSTTEVDGPNVPLGSAYTYHGLFDVRETKPGGGAWTIADVNSAEFGVKVTV
jgi:hypothetical protein